MPLTAAPAFRPPSVEARGDVEMVKHRKWNRAHRHWRAERRHWRAERRHWNRRHAWQSCRYYGNCYPHRYYYYGRYYSYRDYYPRHYRRRPGVSIYLSF
jgi:hypothetical protein